MKLGAVTKKFRRAAPPLAKILKKQKIKGHYPDSECNRCHRMSAKDFKMHWYPTYAPKDKQLCVYCGWGPTTAIMEATQ